MTSVRAIAVSLLCVACVLVGQAQSGFTGKWQGETGNGRKVLLNLNVKGQQLTGTFTLGQQTVDITDGKGRRRDLLRQDHDRGAVPADVR